MPFMFNVTPVVVEEIWAVYKKDQHGWDHTGLQYGGAGKRTGCHADGWTERRIDKTAPGR